jgi:hypothetical protein
MLAAMSRVHTKMLVKIRDDRFVDARPRAEDFLEGTGT